MQEKEFIAFVDKLELYERQHPTAYRLRVALLAALGYLLLFGVLVILLIFIGLMISLRMINYLVIQVLAVLIGVSYIIVSSLLIALPEPEGDELKREQAPRLYELVNEVRAATDGPKLYKILLTREYNAGIEQRPRLGVLGWHQNYLRVGLPLLGALSLDDFRAVLAHEFGHLSGNHGKFSGWIYRVRQTWVQVMENTKKHPRYGLEVFQRFFNWYAPYFAAYSFVLARAQEYEADRCSVVFAGKDAAARALINLEPKGRALNEDFWPAFYHRADHESKPPRDTFVSLLQSLREPVAPDKAQLWFTESLTAKHRYDDTHPALADRLAAIGYSDVRDKADLSSFAITNGQPYADQCLLAQAPNAFIERQNKWWRDELAHGWKERNKFVLEAEQALATLEEKAKTAELTVEDLWDRARYVCGLQDNSVALPLLQQVLVLLPDHAAANYTIGATLLTHGDEAGIKHLEVAMEKDVTAVPEGCRLIYDFLVARERGEEAEKYRQCVVNYYNELELAKREREKITIMDDFEPHGLTAEELQALQAQLARFPLLRSAYFVRKVCKHLPDEPGYVLGVTSKRVLFGLQLDGRDKKLVDALATSVKFPGYTFIIALEHKHKPQLTVFRRVESAEVYRAS